MLSLPASDFFGHLAAIYKAERKEYQEGLKQAAFIGWQGLRTATMIFNEKPPSFLEYCESLNLLTPHEKELLEIQRFARKQHNQQLAAAAMKNAANIISLNKKTPPTKTIKP